METPGTTAASQRPRHEPAWISDAIGNARAELASFASTFWTLLRSPYAFADAWAEGGLRALNPLAFALNSLAALGAYAVLVSKLAGLRAPGAPIWFDFVRSGAFLFAFAMSALFFHLAARLAGSSARFTSTLALSLYVGAGPVSLTQLVFFPLQDLWLAHRLQGQLPASLAGLLQIAVMGFYAIATQRGLHHVPWLWLLVAFAAFVAADVALQNAVFAAHPDWLAWMLS